MPITYVCTFVFTPAAKEVLLIRKTHPPFMRGLLNGIGGHVKDNEPIDAAAVRELCEEAGPALAASITKVTTTVIYTCPNVWQVHFFRAFMTDPDAVAAAIAYAARRGEQINAFPVGVLTPRLMGNVPWLIAMSLDEDIDFPAEIRHLP